MVEGIHSFHPPTPGCAANSDLQEPDSVLRFYSFFENLIGQMRQALVKIVQSLAAPKHFSNSTFALMRTSVHKKHIKTN